MFVKVNKVPYNVVSYDPDHYIIQCDTLLCSYNVSYDSVRKQNLTTFMNSLDKDLTYYHYNYLYEDDCGKFCTKILNFYSEALRTYSNFRKKTNEKITIPKYIIVLREGVSANAVGAVLGQELEPLKKLIKEIYNDQIKIVFIFVDKKSDLKLYENCSNKFIEEKSGMDDSFIESTKVTKNDNDIEVKNPPVGTLIDNEIPETENNFYLTSAYTPQGTSTFVNYTNFNYADLPTDFIYSLVNCLTYSYYNCSRSIRIPFPTHMISRLSKLVISYLHEELKYNNIGY